MAGKRIKDMIKEEIDNVDNFIKDPETNLPPDDIYEPATDVSGSRFMGSYTKALEEDRVIDELLASVPQNQGYYLKLYKEIRPNDFELKLRVDTFDTWSDLEWEITNLIRSYTLKAPQKWGSGHYRVIIWREGGVRGSKFKPLDFHVDAMEIATNEGAHSNGNDGKEVDKLKDLSELVKTIQGLYPQVNPGEIQSKIFESFKAGIDAKAQSVQTDSANQMANQLSTNQLMLELIKRRDIDATTNKPNETMTLLSILLPKLLDSSLQKKEVREDDFLDKLIKLKAAGILGDDKPKEDQMTKALETLSTIIPLVKSLGGGDGGNESGSVLIELVKQLAPQAGKIIGDVTGTINNAIGLKSKSMSGNVLNNPPVEYSDAIPIKQITPNNPVSQPSYMDPYKPSNQSEFDVNIPNQTYGHSITNNPVEQPIAGSSPEEIAMLGFFKKFRNAIENSDTNFFPELKGVLQGVVPPDTFTQIVEGTVPISVISDKIRPYGGEFFSLPISHKYMTEFITWLRSNEVVGKCSACNEEYIYDSKEQLAIDNKCNCGGQINEVIK